MTGQAEDTITNESSCYIGIGSNLEHPVEQARQAIEELGNLESSYLAQCSSLYQSDPMGPADQPRYVNAVARLSTTLPALDFLDALQQLENQHGRERTRRWGARTLDLDLLLYGDQVICTERLTVPHPGIASRSFVLLPLLEITPDLHIPGAGSAAELLKGVPDLGIEKLPDQQHETSGRP